MSVVLLVVCERCGAEHRPDRPVRSFSPGAVRTRAAFHGWEQVEVLGVKHDLCPACVQAAVPAQQQVARRVLVEAASAASSAPARPAEVVHPVRVDVEVAKCHWCAEEQHQWCLGCECLACA